jgi:ferredoxin-NADP reductase
VRQDRPWTTATVRAVRDAARDVRQIDLEPDVPVARPEPGSHIDVVAQVHGRPERRSYSVVAAPAPGQLRIAVKQLPDGRGGSSFMGRLTVGEQLLVSRPQHLFRLAYDAPGYVLVAGGIGITPLYGMALALARRGALVRLLYTARSTADMPFLDELREVLGDALEVFASSQGQRLRLPDAFDGLPADGLAYVCGPLRLQVAVREAWESAGRPARHLRTESFGSSGRFPAEPFTLRIPRLDKTVEVPSDRTILDALLEAGVPMIADCLRGECGLCVLPILAADGIVDHRDAFLSPAQQQENAAICTCVSRAVGCDLVLDTFDR